MELLERATFLQTLDEYAAQAAAGQGRFVLVAGEAGIGKTALLESFRRTQPSLHWWWAACDGAFTPRPLGPLYELATADGGHLLELFRAGADRNALFSAFLDRLSAEPGPSAVVVEDLHWADEATLDWLAHLARRLSTMSVLVLVTYRNDDLPADSALRTAIATVATQRPTRRMTLPTLSPAAVATLAGRRGRADASALHRLSGGNPFYVEELLSSAGSSVPESVSDVTLARTARLTDDARQLVWAAAVIQQPATAQDIAHVAGRDPAHLDECLASGGLVGSDGSYRFRHELTRMAVEEHVPAYRRAQLHAAAYHLLASRPGTGHARLAHHAEAAGMVDETLHHARAAAQEAAALVSTREAALQYERALRSAGHATDQVRAELHEGLANALSYMDRWEEALPHQEEAVRFARTSGDREHLARTLRALATTRWRLCDGPGYVTLVDELYELVREAPVSREKLWAFVHQAARTASEGRPDEGLALSEKAHAMALELGDAEMVASTMQSLAWDRILAGQDGWAQMDESLRLAKEGGFAREAARGYANFYQLAVDHLRIAEHDWLWEEGEQYNAECELPTYRWCLRGSRGTALVRTGRLTEAVDLCRATLAEQISPVNRLHVLTALGSALGRLGSPDAAARVDECRELAVANGEPYWSVLAAVAALQHSWLTSSELADRSWVLDTWERSRTEDAWVRTELAVWLVRNGLDADGLDDPVGPHAPELGGDPAASAREWRRLGFPFEEAAALLACPDPADLRRALDLFTDVGSAPGAALARRRLKELGEHGIPRGPRATTAAHPRGLTAREQEVLDLVAEGLSNREISGRLFISQRTVDHHVAAVLTKLGVDSRAGAVASAAGAAHPDLGTSAVPT